LADQVELALRQVIKRSGRLNGCFMESSSVGSQPSAEGRDLFPKRPLIGCAHPWAVIRCAYPVLA